MHMIIMTFAGRDQFDRHFQFLCVKHIFLCDLCDTFCINILKINLLPGDERRKDRDLAAGIISFHIRFRIALRIAVVLSLFQDLIIISPFIKHLTEHIVGCSIQDACDFFDLVCCQAGIQCADDRDAAAHARFKQEIKLSVTCN